MKENLTFIYPRNRKGQKSGHTIAVLIKDGMIFFGESLCSEEDHFNKVVGREMALARAEDKYEKYLARIKKRG